MSYRLFPWILGFCFAASAAYPLNAIVRTESVRLLETVYISSDLAHVTVFTKDEGRIGNDLAISGSIWPSSSAKYFQPFDGVQCVSLGESSGSVQFAIKRPIRISEKFQCLKSKFQVVKCFIECRAAVIEVNSPLGANRPGFITSYIYVDDCFGILAFDVSKNLNKGMPPSAPWLRGPVGILANPDYPECRPF